MRAITLNEILAASPGKVVDSTSDSSFGTIAFRTIA